MSIRPKYTSSKTASFPKEKREFIDREEFINSFFSNLNIDPQKRNRVLVYCGVGGIGKTSLRKKLCNILDLENKNVSWTSLDFNIPSYRVEDTAIYYMRKTLKDKYKIQFPSFDIAYAVYWQKTHPQIHLTKKNLDFLDDSEIIHAIISTVGNIPIIGLLPGIAKTVLKSHAFLKTWWFKRGQKELMELPDLEAVDILERLPYFFSADLKENILNTGRNIVLFFDTYEALCDDNNTQCGYFSKDEWIRELAAQIPEAILVIFGRERLRWNEIDSDWNNYIYHQYLDGLTENDAGGYLISCGINEESTRNKITGTCKGIPYFLDLCVDTYYAIKNTCRREPEENDFAANQSEVLDRFLKNLERNEFEMLKILSPARSWNKNIFGILINKFNTAYPVTGLKELYRFSFIDHTPANGCFTMHDYMREGLIKKLDEKDFKTINKILFEYYNGNLLDINVKNISDTQKLSFAEAAYYGKNFLDIPDYLEWFDSVYQIFAAAKQWKLLLPILTEIENTIKNTSGVLSVNYANVILKLGRVEYALGDFVNSEDMFFKSLDIYNEALGETNIESEKLLNNLGYLYNDKGKYADSENCFDKALLIHKELNNPEDDNLIGILNGLAWCYNMQEKCEQASELLLQALEIAEKNYGADNIVVSGTLNNLANIYFARNNYAGALELYERSIAIKENSLGRDNPAVANTLVNIAEVYIKTFEFIKAEDFENRALDIYLKSYGEIHQDTAFSVFSLARINEKKNNRELAEKYLDRAHQIYESLKFSDGLFSQSGSKFVNIMNDIIELKEKLKFSANSG